MRKIKIEDFDNYLIYDNNINRLKLSGLDIISESDRYLDLKRSFELKNKINNLKNKIK